MKKQELLDFLESEREYLNWRIEELNDHTDYTTSLLNWLEWAIDRIEKDDIDWIKNYNPWEETTGLEQEIIFTLHKYLQAIKQ